MTEPKEALTPCPFCDGEAQWVEDHGRLNEPFGLIVNHKPECWLSDNPPAFERDALIAAWDTRAEAPENAALREKLAEREWRPIESAPPKSSPVLGYANGVQFLMLWSAGSHRLNAAFAKAFPDAEKVQEHSPGWYAWAAGLSCYSGVGEKVEVHPTHWMPLPAPPALTGGDNAEG